MGVGLREKLVGWKEDKIGMIKGSNQFEASLGEGLGEALRFECQG